MAKERGIFKLIWKNFIASLKPRSSRKFIGEDYYGTKYYEEEPRPSNPNRPPRYFVALNKNNFDQTLPVEWEAWLRHRRKNPPTREEIEFNYQLAMTKKENAAKLSNQYSNRISASLPAQSTNGGNFPVYEEYKNFGQNNKKDK